VTTVRTAGRLEPNSSNPVTLLLGVVVETEPMGAGCWGWGDGLFGVGREYEILTLGVEG
jgi:hypothetical protein